MGLDFDLVLIIDTENYALTRSRRWSIYKTWKVEKEMLDILTSRHEKVNQYGIILDLREYGCLPKSGLGPYQSTASLTV